MTYLSRSRLPFFSHITLSCAPSRCDLDGHWNLPIYMVRALRPEADQLCRGTSTNPVVLVTGNMTLPAVDLWGRDGLDHLSMCM